MDITTNEWKFDKKQNTYIASISPQITYYY